MTAAGFWGFTNSGRGGIPTDNHDGFWNFANERIGGNSKELQKLIDSQGVNSFNIVDQVQVPEGRTGDFVFQWRWDSEDTPQVWTQCAVITIEE